MLAAVAAVQAAVQAAVAAVAAAVAAEAAIANLAVQVVAIQQRPAVPAQVNQVQLQILHLLRSIKNPQHHNQLILLRVTASHLRHLQVRTLTQLQLRRRQVLQPWALPAHVV